MDNTTAPSAPSTAVGAFPSRSARMLANRSTAHTPWVWWNGEMIEWEEAGVHVMTYALHMGASVFEGIRCYATHQGPVLFRNRDHIRRLADSARIYGMELPFDVEVLLDACRRVVRENNLSRAYLRPLAWLGLGDLGTDPGGKPVEVMIAALNWGAYLGEEGLSNGVDVGVSSWRRVGPDMLPSGAKAGGAYLSSQLIRREAKRHGYHEGIALDASGFISEGSSDNIFLVRDGVLYTPPVGASILPGITRDTVLTLATDQGITVREAALPRESLYVADEIFLTGTAVEVTPVRSIDGVPVGRRAPGALTQEIQRLFFGLFDGRTEDKRQWLDRVTSHEI